VDTKDFIGRSFYKTFEALKTKSGIDCTYSGSTAIVCYFQEGILYACNVGDSRAVLAVEEDKKYIAVPLSSDQTPARDDEKKRILKCGGRVEPCQDEDGSYIGPQRVWLKNRAVPGLAMTRSFGDTIATPIGVSPVPEIYERKLEKKQIPSLLLRVMGYGSLSQIKKLWILSHLLVEILRKRLKCYMPRRINVGEKKRRLLMILLRWYYI